MIEIKAIIVDDEINGAKSLQSLLHSYCSSIKVIAIAHSAEQAIEIIGQQTPDLLFLDIEMPVINGFQLLEKLGKISFDVIFTTAYDQFALQAFKTNATSYLLKPIDSDELILAVQKVIEKRNDSPLDRIQKMEKLLQDLKNQNTQARLPIHTSEGVTFLDSDKIIRLEADSNYTHIFLIGGKKITSAKTLKEYEEVLIAKNFFRIHHAHLVNLRYIEKYIKGEGGYVVTVDQTTLEVSRRKKPELMEALLKMS